MGALTLEQKALLSRYHRVKADATANETQGNMSRAKIERRMADWLYEQVKQSGVGAYEIRFPRIEE